MIEDDKQPTAINKNNPPRISGAYLKGEFRSIISLEKGFLFSVKELILDPQTCINDFFYKDRTRLVKPITFVIFCTTISIIINAIFGSETEVDEEFSAIPSDPDASALAEIVYRYTDTLDWIATNEAILNIFLALFIALWLKLLVRKTDYNFFEVLVLVAYTIGIVTLIGGVTTLLEWFFNTSSGFVASMLTFGAFIAFIIGRFLSGNKAKNYLKGLIACVLGSISMFLTFMLVFFIFVVGVYLIEK